MYILQEFFKEREVVLPRESLGKEIFTAVLAVQNMRMKRRLRMAYFGIMASLGVLLYSGFTAGETFFESDFWNIISVAFSDMAVVANFWNDFLFSLLETFPAFSVALILFPAFLFFIFLNMYAGVQRNHYSFNH